LKSGGIRYVRQPLLATLMLDRERTLCDRRMKILKNARKHFSIFDQDQPRAVFLLFLEREITLFSSQYRECFTYGRNHKALR
jgi:hypothetical protein